MTSAAAVHSVVQLAFACSLLWSACALYALWRVLKRPKRPLRVCEPVSILKPITGRDDALESNLRGFFEQRYGRYELIFGVQDPQDPALGLLRKLRAQYPHVDSRIVVHGQRGLNPKVSNLRAMLGAARWDVLAISDSNVAADPGWLSELVAELQVPGVGLVFNLVAGAGAHTLGAALENLQLNGPVAAGMAAPTELADQPTVVGKSMALRRSQFERLGGFESVASLLAEDYVIGRMFRTAGLRVRAAPSPVVNLNQTTSVRGFFERQLRWAMLRVRLNPVAYALEPLTSPFVVGLLATAVGRGGAWLGLGLLLTLLRDVLQILLLRGSARALGPLPLLPLRELLALGAWAGAPFCKHVRWRGQRLRLGAGTHLYVEQPLPQSSPVHIEP